MESREIEASRPSPQEKECHQKRPGARMRHDEKQSPRSSGLILFVVEADEEVGCKSHQFPRDEKQNRVGRGENGRQADEQQAVEKAEDSYGLSGIKALKVSERIDRYGQAHNREGKIEVARERVQTECVRKKKLQKESRSSFHERFRSPRSEAMPSSTAPRAASAHTTIRTKFRCRAAINPKRPAAAYKIMPPRKA